MTMAPWTESQGVSPLDPTKGLLLLDGCAVGRPLETACLQSNFDLRRMAR